VLYRSDCASDSQLVLAQFTELMSRSGHDLFSKSCAPTHALNHLLPPAKNCVSLRTRGRSNQLPEYSTDEKSFLIRCFVSEMILLLLSKYQYAIAGALSSSTIVGIYATLFAYININRG